MGLFFIFGKPGSGKTHYCIENILRLQSDSSNRSVFYIVPEQFSLQSEKSLVRQSQGSGLLNASAFGFTRLAFSVFDELGMLNRKNLDEIGKNMLIRKILGETELLYYKNSYDKQGFVDELCMLVTEFYQNLDSPNDLFLAANVLNRPEQETLRLKMTDLYNIFRLYCKYQQENMLTSDDTLDLLTSKIKYSRLLDGADIFIDGFKGFTPQEYAVIEELLKKVNNIYISLTIDTKSLTPETINEESFFQETKSTAQNLSTITEECGLKQHSPIYLTNSFRYTKSPDLLYLRDNFYDPLSKAYNGNAENIRIYEADSMISEIHHAARLILLLAREKGFRFSEIGIITSVLPDYEKSVKAIFRQYNIPVFIDAVNDILSHPLCEYIRAILQIIIGNWQYESVFRLLKTNLVTFSQDEIDRLENYVLAYGIRGNRWKKPFTYGFTDDSEGAVFSETVNSARENVVSMLSLLESRHIKRETYAIEDFCKTVYETLLQNGIPAALEVLAEKAMVYGDMELANGYRRIWDKIITILDRMVDILGKEKVQISEFAKIFDAGLSGMDMGNVPPSLDQIIVGDIRRSRFSELKALLILGANDGMFPGRTDETGLLTDNERELLRDKAKMRLGQGSFSKANEEQFLIYCALSTPSVFLGLSRFRGGIDGKSYMRSRVIDAIMNLFPNIIEKDVTNDYSIKGVTSLTPMFNSLSSKMRHFFDNGEIPPLYMDIYAYFNNNNQYKKQLNMWKSVISDEPLYETLSPYSIKRLYGGKLRASVSKLEKYTECPFSYFMRYNVNANERKLYEVLSVDVGNVFHSALNRFAQSLKDSGKKWQDVDSKTLLTLADNCIDATLNEESNEILKSSSQFKYFGERVKDITKRSLWALNEHMKRGGFSLAYTEIAFSPNENTPGNLGVIEVPLTNGNEMFLEGRIDRIDLFDLEDKQYVKILDYKSGNKIFHYAEAYYGLQLQLILYLDAFIKKIIKIKGQDYADSIFPGAMLYFTLSNPMITLPEKTDEETLLKAILKEYKMSGVVLKDKNVIKALDNDFIRSSDLIPVSMVKGDSSGETFDDMEFSKNASVLSVEGFNQLMLYTLNKAEQIGNEILSGKITVEPYQFKQSTGCRFCPYLSICRFEPRGRKGYKRMEPISDKKAMEAMIIEGNVEGNEN